MPKRVAVRKVYVLRVALLGLYIGIIVGLLMAEVAFFLFHIAVKAAEPYMDLASSAGYNLAPWTTPDFLFNISLGILGLNVLFFPLLFICLALFYNLLAKLGGAVHLGLLEYEIKK